MVLNVLSDVKVVLTQSSARSRKSESLSIKGVSPLTEAMMLGIWARSCASVVISFIVGVGFGFVVGVWKFYLLCIGVFVQRGKLDERHLDVNALPSVKADDYAVDGKEQVVIRFLKGLGDGVKLALVGAGVVALGFAGN